MSRPSVSGIAIDTFFSRIGMPLFHRYQVFDRQGSHPAFHGTYMPKLFDLLKGTDAESIRCSHRRRAKEIAASMSQERSGHWYCDVTDSSAYLGSENKRSRTGSNCHTCGRDDGKECRSPTVGGRGWKRIQSKH